MSQAYLKIYHPQTPILNCEKNLSTILYYVIYFVYLCKSKNKRRYKNE